MDKPPSDREPSGRFATGHAGGPGRPKGKGYQLQRAAQEAISTEHFAAMMRRAMRMALEGNLQAMRFVAERVCGKAPDAPADATPLDINPPRLRTATDCTAAVQKLTDAICHGTIDIMHGKVLLDAIQTQARLLEVTDLEARLIELEHTARVIEATPPTPQHDPRFS